MSHKLNQALNFLNGHTKKRSTGKNLEMVGLDPHIPRSSPKNHLAALFAQTTFVRLGDDTRREPRAATSVVWACGTCSRAVVWRDSASRPRDVVCSSEISRIPSSDSSQRLTNVGCAFIYQPTGVFNASCGTSDGKRSGQLRYEKVFETKAMWKHD